ncbi:sensor histidine kinase [Clostridium lacusfryxellense]|uniref:sensor histidine kinase n=1 Tax=Clostridium lacusfryxellense TaxID=205328 RepID=UPI001C0E5D38|nr:histidine kinase [Clostridium lacusfryxellense]MBU3110274.1 histidine kinase [Clostridium lacusfryxellense]
MKCKRINFLRDFLKFKTIQQRLIFIVVIETTVSLLLLVLVSYQTIHSIEKNKLKTSMVTDLQQFTEKMTQNYMNMIQVSQQMSPVGTVGSLLDSYFQAHTKYDVYRIGQEISDSLVNITFANSNIICRTYYNPLTGQKYFNGFFTYAGTSPETNRLLQRNGSIDYHPLHLSNTMGLGTWQVLSISRKINIASGMGLTIYIESRLEGKEIIDGLSKAQNMHYVLLQLDNNKRVAYSSSEDFTVGKSFQLEDEKEVGNSYFGKSGKYVGVRLTADTGFVNVLLLPTVDYNRELYTWIRNVIGILVLAIVLFGFSFILLSRLIYTPLSVFSKEMKKLGKGDLNAVKVNTGAVEYDELFNQFNTMKKQIQTLLMDVENVAHEKYQLEVEKIYYQINPHFLMNTLHSIHWLAKMHQQTEIEIFTTELNYILAYSLGKSDKNATVRTEIKMLQSYLRLQKMRYDFKAEVEVEDGDYLDTQTARMIVQPIAENAIRHGLGEPGCLWIKVCHSRIENAVILTIEDNGKGLTTEELARIQKPFKKGPGDVSKTNGIGLRYVRSMLESFYGDKAIINIKSELNIGTKVTLILPINRE